MDDFSVSAKERQTCTDTIAEIGKYLQVPLNDLGLIKKFKGVNILQTRWYIKVSCQDYITRILTVHNWLSLKTANLPVPMRSDPAYQRQLETAIRPTEEKEQNEIQTQAGWFFIPNGHRGTYLCSRCSKTGNIVCNDEAYAIWLQSGPYPLPGGKDSVCVPQQYKRGWPYLLAISTMHGPSGRPLSSTAIEPIGYHDTYPEDTPTLPLCIHGLRLGSRFFTLSISADGHYHHGGRRRSCV